MLNSVRAKKFNSKENDMSNKENFSYFRSPKNANNLNLNSQFLNGPCDSLATSRSVSLFIPKLGDLFYNES